MAGFKANARLHWQSILTATGKNHDQGHRLLCSAESPLLHRLSTAIYFQRLEI